MRRKILLGVCAMALFAGVYGIPADAAFEPELEAAYNTAVQGQDTLEGLNVSVTERTVSSATNLAAEKTMELKVSGIQTYTLKADIQKRRPLRAIIQTAITMRRHPTERRSGRWTGLPSGR